MKDDDVERNGTLYSMLAKIDDGKWLNRAGKKVQELLRDLRMEADNRGGSVTGEVTITLRIPMGKTGESLYSARCEVKRPKGKSEEGILVVDEDGDISGRIMPPKQTSLYDVAGVGPEPARVPRDPRPAAGRDL